MIKSHLIGFTIIFLGTITSLHAQFLSSQWQYIEVDSTRDKWGDYDQPQ